MRGINYTDEREYYRPLKLNKMKKEEKFYNPDAKGSFKMMFGFTQPYVYVYVPVVIRKERKAKDENN